MCIQAAHLCSRRLSVKTSTVCIHAEPHASQVTEKEFARLASSELPRLQGDSRGTTFTHEQLQRTFAKADLNGDGEIDFNEFFLWLSGGAKGESRNVSPDLHRSSTSSPLGGAAEGAAGSTAGGAPPIEGRKELDERLLKETDRRHVHGRAWAWATMRLHAHAHDSHAHAHAHVHVHIMQPYGSACPCPRTRFKCTCTCTCSCTCECTETCTYTCTTYARTHACTCSCTCMCTCACARCAGCRLARRSHGIGEIDQEAADANAILRERRQARKHAEREARLRALEAARLDCATLLAQIAERRDRGEVPSTEYADHMEPMSPRALRAAWKQFEGGLDAGGGGSGSGSGGGGVALGFEAFGALVSQLVAAQGRPPLSTFEQLGLFASCDLDSSQDIDFNEWCGVFPLLAALLEKQQSASTAARSRAAIAASAAVTSGDGGGGKVLVGAGEGAPAALQLKLTGSGPAVRTKGTK